MLRALAVVFVSLALLAAGCGGDDNGGGGGGGGSSATEGADSGGGTSSHPVVTLKNIAFNPATLNTKTGTTVKWLSEDSASHDVTQTGGPGPRFKSGSAGGLKTADTYTHKFTKPGTYDYRCTIHPNMKGKIVVR